MATEFKKMRQRRGTLTQWTAANPVLSAGEIAVVQADAAPNEVIELRVGDGTTAFSALSPIGGGSSTLEGLDDVDLGSGPINGRVLRYLAGTGWSQDRPVTTFLEDVAATFPSAGQILRFIDTGATQQYEPVDLNLAALSDVNPAGAADGDALVRRSGVWVPEAISSAQAMLVFNTVADIAAVTIPTDIDLVYSLTYDGTYGGSSALWRRVGPAGGSGMDRFNYAVLDASGQVFKYVGGVVNPMAFGLKPEPGFDNSPLLAELITGARNLQEFVELAFPDGVFELQTPVIDATDHSLMESSVLVRGTGEQTVFFTAATTTAKNLFELTATSSIGLLRFESLKFASDLKTGPTASGPLRALIMGTDFGGGANMALPVRNVQFEKMTAGITVALSQPYGGGYGQILGEGLSFINCYYGIESSDVNGSWLDIVLLGGFSYFTDIPVYMRGTGAATTAMRASVHGHKFHRTGVVCAHAQGARITIELHGCGFEDCNGGFAPPDDTSGPWTQIARAVSGATIAVFGGSVDVSAAGATPEYFFSTANGGRVNVYGELRRDTGGTSGDVQLFPADDTGVKLTDLERETDIVGAYFEPKQEPGVLTYDQVDLEYARLHYHKRTRTMDIGANLTNQFVGRVGVRCGLQGSPLTPRSLSFDLVVHEYSGAGAKRSRYAVTLFSDGEGPGEIASALVAEADALLGANAGTVTFADLIIPDGGGAGVNVLFAQIIYTSVAAVRVVFTIEDVTIDGSDTVGDDLFFNWS